MGTTPLWVPLVVAVVAVLGTLSGVIFTQLWNSRLDEKRWKRETQRLSEAQAREDLNRTYEHRRVAYIDFLEEFDRLLGEYEDYDRKRINNPDYLNPILSTLGQRLAVIAIYGTHESEDLAHKCRKEFLRDRDEPGGARHFLDMIDARNNYVSQIRKDLGLPERKPAD
jgi:hypothetical protein